VNWTEIKSMPGLKQLRKSWSYREARMTFHKPAPPKKITTHQEVRMMRDSTRRKRARQQSARDRST
jgi:hypothetical protein